MNNANQITWLDNQETFWPVIKATSIQIGLTLTATHQWKLQQLDFRNAFLNGHLEKLILMHQTLGFVKREHPQWSASSVILFTDCSRPKSGSNDYTTFSPQLSSSRAYQMHHCLYANDLTLSMDMIVMGFDQVKINELMVAMGKKFIVTSISLIIFSTFGWINARTTFSYTSNSTWSIFCAILA